MIAKDTGEEYCGACMTLDQESVTILRTTIILAVAFLLIAKIWRECGAETLRRKLLALEIELFEFARRGHLTVGHPAYAMLLNSIRNLTASADEISVTRLFVTTALGRGGTRAATLARHRRQWETALNQVSSEETRAGIVELREQLYLEVRRSMLFGPLPAEALIAVPDWLAAVWRQACLQLVRNARLVKLEAKSPRRLSIPA